MPQPARIDNALPKPLGAPDDWDDQKNGRCQALFIRRDTVNGVEFMRSAWELTDIEALHLLTGSKLVLGIAGQEHPVVHLMVDQLPEDFQPTFTARKFLRPGGVPFVRVEAIYPATGKPPQRVYCEEPIDEGGLSIAIGRGVDKVEELVHQNGWPAA